MFHHSREKHVNFAKLYEQARHVYRELPPVKKRRKRRFIFHAARYLATAFIGVLVIIAILGFTNFVKIKAAYDDTVAGKNASEYAVALLKEGNYESALYFSEVAGDNFESAGNSVAGYQDNFLVKNIPYARKQFEDLAGLLEAASILSRVVNELAQVGSDIYGLSGVRDISFTELTVEQKTVVLAVIVSAEPKVEAIKADLEVALQNLERIEYNGVFRFLKNKLVELHENLQEANAVLAKVLPAMKLAPPLLGYPEKAVYLVLLENKDELRPTGGFLGTYGILEVDSGDIIRFETHDIYHMDMPVRDKVSVEPPAPLKKYLGVSKWYMRDANWSPDWPTSAEQIEWFYHEENKYLTGKDQVNNFDGEFTGVIAITPDFITDLIGLSGPIVVENEEYNRSNFMQLLEYRVEQGYEQLGVPSWHRKEVIGDIAKAIKERLLDLSPSELYGNFHVASDNLRKKNVMLYFKDKTLQAQAEAHNWGGNIRQTEGDFLHVVDANMASYKTDAVINRQLSYTVDHGANGVFSDLEIKYSHFGDFDWRTTRYRTYVRVYAPLGSELVSSSGMSDGTVTAHNEFDKTVFSAFVSVEPKAIGTLRLRYKLPARIVEQADKGAYSLYIQKQPGTASELAVATRFARPIGSFEPTGFFAEKTGDRTLKWETELTGDLEFEVNLK